MNLLRNQHTGAKLTMEEQRPEEGPVEQFARLAAFMEKHPRKLATLLAVMDLLAQAEDLNFTGTLFVDVQSGIVKSKPRLNLR